MIQIQSPCLERWQPTTWQDIEGNYEFKDVMQNVIRNVRVGGTLRSYRTFVHGPSRGGKTVTMQFAIKSLLCPNLNPETLDPCHRCQNCCTNIELYGNAGWEDFVCSDDALSADFRFLYIYIDCTRITETELEDNLFALRGEPDRLQIVFLDELHRLSRRRMDERLLTALDRMKAIVLAASAVPGELDEMFLNRFDDIIRLEKPTADELALFLAKRCEEFGILVEAPERTLAAVAQRSGRVPGLALHVLRRAHRTQGRRLTRKMVDSFTFDRSELTGGA